MLDLAENIEELSVALLLELALLFDIFLELVQAPLHLLVIDHNVVADLLHVLLNILKFFAAWSCIQFSLQVFSQGREHLDDVASKLLIFLRCILQRVPYALVHSFFNGCGHFFLHSVKFPLETCLVLHEGRFHVNLRLVHRLV